MVFDGQTLNIRPKTFSLLLMFLQSPYQVLSKTELLEKVWDDVEVNEQVLFQTMRELRQLFDGEQVIKTHPRKGYAWIMPVEEVSIDENPAKEASIKESPVTTPSVTPNNTSSGQHKRSFFIASLSMILCLMFYFGYTSTNSYAAKLQGSLVVLPVINDIQDTDHQWIYLGAMDQLIAKLQSSEKLGVMNTDYVLEIMKDAGISRAPNQQDIRRIFEVSGASLVVQTQLSGATQDYQLKYTFHFKNDVKRGVIFANNINDGLIQLATKIAVYTGQSLSVSNNQMATEFGSELLVRALELQEKSEHAGAVKLFNSLLQVEPDNIVAHRLLAKSYVGVAQLTQAKSQLLKAIELVEKSKVDNTAELPRIHYGLAFVEYMQQKPDAAIEQLLIADGYAIKNNDWLYRAYIAGLQGMVKLSQKQFEQAYSAYNNALTYHGVIQCPIGKSATLVSLSKVAKTQGDLQLAKDYLDRATSIIDNRNLTLLKPWLEKEKEKLIKNQ